jgi:hypothetical protein
MKSLFQITLVVFVVLITVAFLTFLLIGMVNVLAPHEVAETGGVSAWAGGVSFRVLYFLLLAAAFLIAGLYFYLRRRKLHR